MERRITSTTGTIPAPNILAGNVTTANVTNKLHYLGSDDVATIYGPSLISAIDSPSWIYVHGVAPFLARVTGLYKNATDDYTIFLDRPFPGVTNVACSAVPAPIRFDFEVTTGTATITTGSKGAQAVAIAAGNGAENKAYQLYAQQVKLQTPVYVDASGGDVLINEESSQGE